MWHRRLAIPLLVVSLSAIAFPGCDTDASDDLWDPDAPVGEAPVIESIDTPSITLAGVDVLTINGQNFSTDAGSNVVFFDAVRVPVLEATATQIRVRAPNTPKTGVQIRVAVIGGDAESFSNVVTLDLLPATEEFGDTLPSELPYATASDADGNLFVSIFQGGVSVGIRRITPEGEASQYYTTTFRWDGLDFGPDGALYGARGVLALFRFPPEGGTQATWAVESNTSVVFSDLDFDNLGNVWAVGDNESIYRVASDKSITAFPFSGDVRAVKVAGSDLFLAVMDEGGGEIWRFVIDGAGDIGAGEQYFDFGASAGSETEVLSLEVAANGDVFVGTDATDPIWVVHPDKTAEALYPGVLSRPAASLSWLTDTFLIMAEGLRPGETEPVLHKINTRLNGIR
jgi:hypothetical protein